MCTDRHPDAALLRDLRAALDRWEASGTTEHPTSGVTGGGAIEELEGRFAALHGRPHAVAVPSATYGLRAALDAVGVRSGTEVLVPAVDWAATADAVASLGARPVPVPVRPEDLTIDPRAAAGLRTGRTTAAVACHLHGVYADVDGLRAAVEVPVVEDVAGALGSTLGELLAGTRGDAAVFSLGPGKQVDAGEGGVVVCTDGRIHERLLATTAHPVRLRLSGVTGADRRLPMRMHPAAAILALHRLHGLDLPAARRRWRDTADRLGADPSVAWVLGSPDHRPAASEVAVVVRTDAPVRCTSPTGASSLTGLDEQLLARVRVVPVDRSEPCALT